MPRDVLVSYLIPCGTGGPALGMSVTTSSTAEEGGITEFIKKVLPLLPNPCHFQNYDQSMSHGSNPPMPAFLPSRLLFTQGARNLFCQLIARTAVTPPKDS